MWQGLTNLIAVEPGREKFSI